MTIIMICAKAEANEYLKEHKIEEFFEFLIAHLIIDQPEDLIKHLGELLDKCILFRAGLIEPPSLFKQR